MAEPRRPASDDFSDLKGVRILVVEARFYDDIADALLAGAMRVLDKAGAKVERVTVPGSLEIPSAIAIAVDEKYRLDKLAGAVALGCVIRGDTIHFEIVSQESARGLMNYAVTNRFPVGNGILTVDNEQQAWVRARPEEGDKGGDAARACLTMVRLKRRVAAR